MTTPAHWTGTPEEYADAQRDAHENYVLDEAARLGRADGARRGAAYEIVQPDHLVSALLINDADFLPWPIREDLDLESLGLSARYPETLTERAQIAYEEAAMEAFEATLMRRAMAEIGWVQAPIFHAIEDDHGYWTVQRRNPPDSATEWSLISCHSTSEGDARCAVASLEADR